MISFLKEHKNFSLALLILLIFFSSFGVHYFIYYSKGFIQTQYCNLLIARNWAQTGKLSFESEENVVLSTEAVVSQGVPTNLGNKLNFFIYGFLFRFFGFHPELPIYLTFILYSIATVLIFLIVRKILDFKTGLVAAFLINLAPFSLPSSGWVGHHEWAWLFLVLASVFYFWPKERKWKLLILTGLFLGLSAAAKNSFFVVFPAFLLLEFWENRHVVKTALLRSAVLSVVFLFIVAPFIFIGGNIYFSVLLDLPNKYSESFLIFGHLFPDPYTFHYDKDNYLNNLISANQNASLGEKIDFWGKSGLLLQEYGVKMSFFKSEIFTRVFSAWIYFKGLFLSLVVFGGLLTWLLIFIGVNELLKRKNYSLLFFAGVLFASWFLFLFFLRTSNYSQDLILSLPVVILVSVGIIKLSEIVSNSLDLKRIKTSRVAIGIIVIFLIFFFQISWWSIRELSLNFGLMRGVVSLAKTEEIKQAIDPHGVTAVGWSEDATNLVAYYLNRNFIYFAPQTIIKIANEGKILDVFRRYKISGFLGYDKQISEIINKGTNNSLKNYSSVP